MKNITFLLDSGSDYESNLDSLFDFPVRIVPLYVNISGVEYQDSVSLSKSEFYEKMAAAEHLPKTSQPTPTQFYEVYIEELAKGNDVLCITISSKLSGTYQSAMIGRDMLDEKFVDRVHVADSLNVTGMVTLQLIKANQLIKEGLSLADVVVKLAEYRKKTTFIALLDTLENLKKGGRISATKAAVGGLLNVKPLVTINDGLMEATESFRGRKKGLESLSAQFAGILDKIEKDRLIVIHNYQNIELLKADLKNFKLTDFKSIEYVVIGPTIGTYAGPNVLGFGYVMK